MIWYDHLRSAMIRQDQIRSTIDYIWSDMIIYDQPATVTARACPRTIIRKWSLGTVSSLNRSSRDWMLILHCKDDQYLLIIACTTDDAEAWWGMKSHDDWWWMVMRDDETRRWWWALIIDNQELWWITRNDEGWWLGTIGAWWLSDSFGALG